MANDLRYIFNMPIEIDGIGKLYSFTMDEYIKYNNLFDVLSITLNNILQNIPEDNIKQREEIENNVKIFDIIISEEYLLNPLCELLYYSFHADNVAWNPSLQQIRVDDGIVDRNNFDYISEQIMKSNNLQFTKQAKTKELQEWFDKKSRLNSSKNNVDMEDIITSIMAFTGYTPDQILKLSIYQINSLIERLNKISDYESNVQFLCVGAKDIKLEHWCSHIENKNYDTSMSMDKFTNDMGEIISNKQ